MSFEVGVATYEAAAPYGRHRIATSVGPSHAYLFDLWDNPPGWFAVPATDLQPKMARALIDAAEAGEANILEMVRRCEKGFFALQARTESLYAGAGAVGAFVTFPTPERIEIGWMSDARVYRVGDQVEQLTKDHDLLNAYLEAVPDLSEEQRAELPKGIRLRAIGTALYAEPKFREPEVVPGELEIGQQLVLVPKGIDEKILGNPRIRSAPTAEAAAKLVVALAIAENPSNCTGAIVIRRTNDASRRPMIRELIAKCPDPTTENVIADWCEENRRAELVAWLRNENADVRACAVNHLAATLEPGFTAASFRSAAALARALGMQKWMHLAERVMTIDYDRTAGPPAFFATAMGLSGGKVESVTWALAKELLTATPQHVSARVTAMAELMTHPCPTCGRTGLVVAEDLSQRDGAGDYNWWTEAHVFCIDTLHVERIGKSATHYEPASV